MKTRLPPARVDAELTERLARTGLRLTVQRRHVYEVLLRQRDHPSAEEVFLRAKKEMPEISMATVYNCLDTLVRCGLVSQVNHDRAATRYCSNMEQHHHFHCDHCGGTFDLEKDAATPEAAAKLPGGYQVNRYEIWFRGICPACGRKHAQSSPVSAP